MAGCAGGASTTGEVYGSELDQQGERVQRTDLPFISTTMIVLVKGCIAGGSSETGTLKITALENVDDDWVSTGKTASYGGVKLNDENIPDSDGVKSGHGFALDITSVPSEWDGKKLKFKVEWTPDGGSTTVLEDETTERTAVKE